MCLFDVNIIVWLCNELVRLLFDYHYRLAGERLLLKLGKFIRIVGRIFVSLCFNAMPVVPIRIKFWSILLSNLVKANTGVKHGDLQLNVMLEERAGQGNHAGG